jgi:hypothetical protein
MNETVLLYEEAAVPAIGVLPTLDSIRLIGLVDESLPDGIFASTKSELAEAVFKVLSREDSVDPALDLQLEVGRFLNLAFDHGLIVHHPLRQAKGSEAIVAESGMPTREEVAEMAIGLVSDVIEDAVSSGLFFGQVAVQVAEIGQDGGALDRAVDQFGSRWRRIAGGLRIPLEVLRVGLPILSIIFAINSLVSCEGPLGSRTLSAFGTGAAVQELKKLNFDRGMQDLSDVHSLEELERRTGYSTKKAVGVFRLRKVKGFELYLEHIDSGSLVILSGAYVGSFHEGVWMLTE